MHSSALTGIQVLGAVIVVVVVNPPVLALFVPLICFFIVVRKQYLAASREVKRLASINR